MKKFVALLACYAFLTILPVIAQNPAKTATSDRTLWLSYMDKIARPVISALAEDKLKEKMPVVLSKNVDNADNRSKVTYLEAFGRTLSGIAPWLNSEGGTKEETALRNQYREWTLKAVANAVNPSAKDYMKWDGGQPLVDASFVALGLIAVRGYGSILIHLYRDK